jgi:Polycystin cation channel
MVGNHASECTQVQSSRQSVLRQLAYLKEGFFVDSVTKVLQGHVTTYNEVAGTFAVVHLACTQDSAGTFEVQIAIAAVPTSAALWRQGAVMGWSRIIMVLLSIGQIAFVVVHHIRVRGTQYFMVRSCLSPVSSCVLRALQATSLFIRTLQLTRWHMPFG